MSSNEVAAWKVASLLINDKTLVLNWELFYSHLGVHPATQIQSGHGFISGAITSFALLNGIIRQWATDKGSQATIRALGEVLRNTRHVALYDELVRTFPNHDSVITLSEGKGVNSNQPTIQFGTEPSPNDIRKYEKPGIRANTTPGGVSILELMPHRQASHGRHLIIISYLLKMLSKIGNNPVAIISINGRQRSGKSFLATQMVKYLKQKGGEGWLDTPMTAGFAFSDSFERVTSGIQVWHEPLQVVYEGKTISVILLDTQGLHDASTGTEENAIIFGFSVLLSSVFIYNELNLADDSLQYLRSFLGFAIFAADDKQHFEAAGSKNSKPVGEQLKFQKLVLLFRDWRATRQYRCGYYDDNHCPPGQVKNLKNATFDTTPDMHKTAVDTREGIKGCFEEISVYAMSGPGNSYPDMEQYLHSSSWDPEFRNGILDFTEALLAPHSIATSTKKVFGEEVTGEELKQYVRRWAEQLQGTHGVIQSQTIFETTAELFFSKKIFTIQKEYETMMNQYMDKHANGVPRDVLQMFHSQTLQQLESRFTLGGAYGGAEILGKYKVTLIDRISQARDHVFKTNSVNIDRQAERQVAERAQQEMRRKAEEAWNATMRQAEARLNDARNDLTISQAKRLHIMNHPQFYTMPVIHKKHNRVLGIKFSPSYYTSIEHDPAAYQAALNLAEEDIRLKEKRVAESEQNLHTIQMSKTARKQDGFAEFIQQDGINTTMYHAKQPETELVLADTLWKKFLQDNLIDLVRLTKCSKSLLSYLKDNNALEAKDIDNLFQFGKSEYESTFDLYEILMDKIDAYTTIRDGLLSDNQIGSYRILQKFSNKFEIDSKKVVFISALEDLTSFIEQRTQPETNVLIISSLNSKISLQRVMDTMSQRFIFHNHKSGSVKSQLKRSLSRGKAFAVRCQSVKSMLKKIGESTKKVVIVTQLKISKIQKALRNYKSEVVVATENISWKDLHPTAQELVLKQPVVIQAQVKSLEKLSSNLPLDRIEGKLLFDLLDGACPELVKNNIPALPNCYWKRQVSVARTMPQDIFRNDTGNDIFVIRGIGLEEFRNLCSSEVADKSSNQIQNLTCRFILLDSEDHYGKICKLTDQPVHLLCYNENKLIWVRSNGSSKVIREQIVHQNQHVMDEDAFIQEWLSAQHPVIMAGANGTGKSTLLSKMGHTIMQENSDDLVLHVALRDLLPKFKAITKDTLYKLLSTNYSDYELGRELVLKQLKSQEIRCHILLDGHGETPAKHANGVKAFMHNMSENKPELDNTKFIVTTTTQDAQEEILGTPAFNLVPIKKEDQINFLLEAWRKFSNIDCSVDADSQKLRDERLREFAATCVDNLSKHMSCFERQIATWPFLSELIAKAYCEDANNYSNIRPLEHQVIKPLGTTATSLFGLYESYVSCSLMELTCLSLKFASRVQVNLTKLLNHAKLDEMLRWHLMYVAIQQLYQKKSKAFRNHLISNFSSGLKPLLSFTKMLHGSHSCHRFVQPSLAQYMVALFVLEFMGSTNDDLRSSLLGFLFKSIFATFGIDAEIKELPALPEKSYRIDTFAFLNENRNVCYFINSLFKPSPEFNNTIQRENWLSDQSPDFTRIFYASLLYDFHNMIQFVIIQLKKDSTKLVWSKVMVLAGEFCSKDMMSTLNDFIKPQAEIDNGVGDAACQMTVPQLDVEAQKPKVRIHCIKETGFKNHLQETTAGDRLYYSVVTKVNIPLTKSNNGLNEECSPEGPVEGAHISIMSPRARKFIEDPSHWFCNSTRSTNGLSGSAAITQSEKGISESYQKHHALRNAKDIKVAAEDEFSIRVDRVIKRCKSPEDFYNNLILLAEKLKVSGPVLMHVSDQMDRSNYVNVVHKILGAWIMKALPQPNLAELIVALRDLDLNRIADQLLLEFQATE